MGGRAAMSVTELRCCMNEGFRRCVVFCLVWRKVGWMEFARGRVDLQRLSCV